uniref:Uncharacterized protein n=1 Tax=Oryza glumipatula TaxID=40148 RepID=A0A0D9Z1S4_9ORYZ
MAAAVSTSADSAPDLRRLCLRPRAPSTPPPTVGSADSAASTTAHTSTGPSLQAPDGSGAPGRIRALTARSGGGNDFCDFVLCPNDCEREVILFFGQMNVIVMFLVILFCVQMIVNVIIFVICECLMKVCDQLCL